MLICSCICGIFALTSILVITFNTTEVFLCNSVQDATQSQTVAPELSRGKVVLAVVVLLLMFIMMMMTYLSYYSFSARVTLRQIPSDDEFISAEDEMSCQGQGYVWDVICALCSTALDQTLDRLKRLAVNVPALLAQDFSTPRAQTVPLFCPSRFPAPPPPPISLCLGAANRWLNIWVLSESRGMLGWLCITSHVAILHAQSLLKCKMQTHLFQTEYIIIHD